MKPAVGDFVGDLSTFRRDYWGRRPYVHRAADPDAVTSVLPLALVDEIVADPSIRPPYVEMYENAHALRERVFLRSGAKTSVRIDDSVDPDAVAFRFSKGATLVLNQPEDHIGHLRALCRAFQAEFLAHTASIAFVTPPSQQGFGLHLDTFEGFIMQTHGTKHWQLYEREPGLPTQPRGMRPGDVDQPVLEVTLQAGDCLYVPWGTPHQARSGDGVSCHLTVMCFPRSWSQFLADVLRRSIPPDAADVLAPRATATERAASDRLVATYLSRTISAAESFDLDAELRRYTDGQRPRPMPAEGFVGRQAAADGLSADSVVAVRVPVERLRIDTRPDGRHDLDLGAGRRMRLPAAAGPVLRELLRPGRRTVFATATAAGVPPGRVLGLARTLVREHVLEVDAPAEAGRG